MFCKFCEFSRKIFNKLRRLFFLVHRKKLEETKLAQKLRVKPHGVNAVALAIGQKVTPEDLLLKVRNHTFYSHEYFIKLKCFVVHF